MHLALQGFRIVCVAMVLMGPSVQECTAQQKVQFTQYMFNSLLINPAYAGADEVISLTLINRNQWTGVDKAPTTQTFSAHTLLKKKQIGLGLSIINDRIGIHKNLNGLANVAYHLKTGNRSYFSMGIQAGIRNMRSDYASLSTGNSDPRLFNQVIAQTSLDLGAGVYWRTPHLHIGLSAPELVPQNVAFNDTVSVQLNKTNLFLFVKYKIELSENFDGEPNVLMKYLPGLPVSFDINMNIIYRKLLTMGLSYRKRESVDFILKAQVTQQLQFGYAYDHTIGNISRLSNGSHEVMVHYIFRYAQSKVSSPR